MLPGLTLPNSLLETLAVLRPYFTALGFVTRTFTPSDRPYGAYSWRRRCPAYAGLSLGPAPRTPATHRARYRDQGGSDGT